MTRLLEEVFAKHSKCRKMFYFTVNTAAGEASWNGLDRGGH